MKRILIGYNERFIYDSLALLFSGIDSAQLIGGEHNEDLLKKISAYTFDILFLEFGQIKRKDVSYILELNRKIKGKSLFIFSSNVQLHFVTQIFDVQPLGFVLKTCSKSDLLMALDHAVTGNNYYCPNVTQLLYKAMIKERKKQADLLTPKEQDILVHVVNGETNYHISEALGICETTVKTHRKNIMRKLKVSNTYELIRYACRENLIDYKNDNICSNCPCCN